MNVIKASSADLIEILYLLKVFFEDVNPCDWFHLDVQCGFVVEDIEKGNVYLLRNDSLSLGMVILKPDETFDDPDISWNPSSLRPLKVKQLIIHPIWKNSTIALDLLQFLETYGNENGFTSIRLEEFCDNLSVIEFINQRNYQEKGKVHLHRKKVPSACFEKLLS